MLHHIARYSTYVPRVPISVHFVHYMLTLVSQRTKKAFLNWLRYFFFVYQRARSYEDRIHVPLVFSGNIISKPKYTSSPTLKAFFTEKNSYPARFETFFTLRTVFCVNEQIFYDISKFSTESKQMNLQYDQC